MLSQQLKADFQPILDFSPQGTPEPVSHNIHPERFCFAMFFQMGGFKRGGCSQGHRAKYLHLLGSPSIITQQKSSKGRGSSRLRKESALKGRGDLGAQSRSHCWLAVCLGNTQPL